MTAFLAPIADPPARICMRQAQQAVSVNTMYVPPYDSLLKRIGSTTEQLEKTDPVPVPGRLLKLLLQLAVAYSDFDEDGYLRVNSDVRNAVERGQIESGHLHYIGYGYFEGRKGGTAVVEEDWYLQKYPDVAAAIKEGRVKSAFDHFNLIGAAEGRSPSAEQEETAAQWKMAMVR
jgi:hypothetical protein